MVASFGDCDQQVLSTALSIVQKRAPEVRRGRDNLESDPQSEGPVTATLTTYENIDCFSPRCGG